MKTVLLATARAQMEADAALPLPLIAIEASESARAAPGAKLYPNGNKAPSPEKAKGDGGATAAATAAAAAALPKRKFILPKQPPKPWQKGMNAEQYKAHRDQQKKAAVRVKIEANERASAVIAARKKAAEMTRAKAAAEKARLLEIEAAKLEALRAEAEEAARVEREAAIVVVESVVEVVIVSGATGTNAAAINGGYLVDRGGAPAAADDGAGGALPGPFVRHNGRVVFSKDTNRDTRLWAAPGPGGQWCISPTEVMQTNVKNGYCFLLQKNAAVPPTRSACKVFNAGVWEKQPAVLVEMCTAAEYADVIRLHAAKTAAVLVLKQAEEVAASRKAAQSPPPASPPSGGGTGSPDEAADGGDSEYAAIMPPSDGAGSKVDGAIYVGGSAIGAASSMVVGESNPMYSGEGEPVYSEILDDDEVVDKPGGLASSAPHPTPPSALAAAAGTPEAPPPAAASASSGALSPIKGRAKRAAAATAAMSAATPVVFGTMNIIGDATNPIEFMPNAADLAGLPGGAASYEAARATAAAALANYTIADATAAVAASAVVADHLAAFAAAQGYSGTESVAALCKEKKIDLGLDNKWTDRLNPIVFGLSPMPAEEGGASPATAAAAAAGPFQMLTQMSAAGADPAAYLARLLGYFATKWPVGDGAAGAAAADSVAGLLLWDLLCTSAVAAAPAAFATLSQPSYLMEAQAGGGNGDGVRTTKAVAREVLLASLAAPLATVLRSHPTAVAIVGCQEMPSEVGPLERALPAGTTVYRAPTASGNITGLIYSTSLKPSFADVSEQLRPELLAYLEAQKVDKKVRETTVRKMVVATFDVPGRGKIAVLVFHCKSFKKLVRSQATFVSHALARAKAVFAPCEAFGVGDMNIEAKWPKGTSAADQAAAVVAAPLGALPSSTTKNSKTFGSVLAAGGYTAYPEAGTITTLKMRTQFQGQPDKEGDLTAVHKDYVLLPTAESTNVRTVVVGGRPAEGTWSSNLELLQPSRYWPADHFTILCVL